MKPYCCRLQKLWKDITLFFGNVQNDLNMFNASATFFTVAKNHINM